MKILFIKSAILGSVLLFLFYYLLLYLVTKDPVHPFNQFVSLQPWMSILVIGFGIQVGLYVLLRRGYRLNLSQKKETKIIAGAGGAMSGTSMVVCCAHHAVDIAPILGVSGTALFLIEYQKEFLIIGTVTNLLGVLYMAWLIIGKKHPKKVLRYVLAERG